MVEPPTTVANPEELSRRSQRLRRSGELEQKAAWWGRMLLVDRGLAINDAIGIVGKDDALRDAAKSGAIEGIGRED
jgi:hypothetical protein